MLNRKHIGLWVLENLFITFLLINFNASFCLANESSGSIKPIPVRGSPNLLGINISAPLDYERDRLYADVIRMSRDFKKGADANSLVLASVDSNGWPLSDFSFYVWADLDSMHGTYTLIFKGKAASVNTNPGGNIRLTYDSISNTSTGKFHYSNPASSFLTLSFTGTRRTDASPVDTGVTSVKFMRPTKPGATQSYPSLALFNDPLKALISKFSVVRFMDFLSTNANIQVNWNDRPLPIWPSFNQNPGEVYGWQGSGGPLEHVILLMNETGKDAWINIPARATDEYILNVARLFAYGSDGVNPYTSKQRNPVYPPLKSNLKLYVEYSNELWNSAGPFRQFHDNCQAASTALVNSGGNSPLNWDKTWNKAPYRSSSWDWKMCNRHTTQRSVEMSEIFRSVFGGNAMGERIRPVLMSQLGNAGAILFDEMQMMLNYYNNMGGNFVTTPHSPNYYFYGGGGSSYYYPSNSVSTLDAFFSDAGMTSIGTTSSYKEDAKLVTAMGLKRVAYEGGPSLDKTNSVRDTLSAQAVQDDRMRSTLVEMHNNWSRNNGDLLVYFHATGNYQWGFTPSVYNLSTPKLLAIDALNASDRAPVLMGMPVPGKISGADADTCSRGWGCTKNRFTADGSHLIWVSYSFLSAQPLPWKVNISFTNTSKDTRVGVYLDGSLIGEQNTSGGELNFNTSEISAGLHSVIIRAAKGSFQLGTVGVKPKQ